MYEIQKYILNWPLPIGAFQGQWNSTKRQNRTTTTVKNPNWPEANRLAIYKCSWEVEPETTRIKFSEWSERVLNPGSPDLKAGALTTGLHCLHTWGVCKMVSFLSSLSLFPMLRNSATRLYYIDYRTLNIEQAHKIDTSFFNIFRMNGRIMWLVFTCQPTEHAKPSGRLVLNITPFIG